jgi:hypothetical protein
MLLQLLLSGGAALIDLDMLVPIGYVNVSDVAAPGVDAAGMRVDADSVNLFNAGAI